MIPISNTVSHRGTHDLEAAVPGLGYLSQAVQRALDMLEVIAEGRGEGMTLTEISTRLALPKSTTLRLLSNLQVRGFIEQDAHKRYRIGLKLFTVGAQALAGNDLRRRSRPYLEELCLKVGESTYLAIVDHDEALYIDRIEPPQPVRAVSPIGAHRPLHATAVGKVFLASMSDTTVDAILSRIELTALTPETLVTAAALWGRIKEVRSRGYDFDIGEYDEGLTCMAAPIHDSNGDTVAAIGISGPTWRLHRDRAEKAVIDLRQSAAAISMELGFRGQSTTS